MAKVKNLLQLQHSFEGGFAAEEGFSEAALENFYDFLKEANLLDQGRTLVDPDAFYWLDPLYRLTRTEILGIKDAQGGWLVRPKYSEGIVMRKASQMGASTWSVSFMIWLAIDKRRPLSIGCYWPTKEELQVFIATRLDPMLQTCEKLQPYLKDADFNNTQAKNIGRSTLYFRHVAGKSAMDSQPMDVVLCDEIRLWQDADGALQRIDERMGQSDIRLRVYMSTVGSPEDFMEARWFESNQLKYYSVCPEGCATETPHDPRSTARVLHPTDFGAAERELIPGVVLSDFDPEKIVATSGRKQATYRCPCCGSVIDNPFDGEYRETRPEAEGMLGLEFARTLSRRVTPWELLVASRTATDKKQFMNGWMAKPFLNAEGRPVKPEHWASARARGEDAGLYWGGVTGGTFLGADFRTNEMHVVIGELGDFEAQGLIFPGTLRHVEVYQGAEWEQRLEELFLQFGVQVALIDYMPNSTGTLKFAKKHEGRVFLAEYRPGDVIRTPSDNQKGVRKISPDGREEYKVSLDQVKSLMQALTGFAQGQWLVPEGPLYQQDYIDRNNGVHPTFDVLEGMEGKGREGFMHHLMCLALENITKEEKNESGETVTISGVTSQRLYDASGFDPHWAHAYNYMFWASRLDGGSAKLLRPSEEVLAEVRTRQAQQSGVPASGKLNLAAFAPGGTSGVRRALRTCGSCHHGPEEGRAICAWSGYDVGASEPACTLTPGWRARR